MEKMASLFSCISGLACMPCQNVQTSENSEVETDNKHGGALAILACSEAMNEVHTKRSMRPLAH